MLDWADGVEAPGASDDPAALGRDRELLRARLRAILERPEVREAIFVSSPELEGLVDDWARDPASPRAAECERALVRFFARMSGRPTPFGLFAGMSTGVVGETTSLAIDGMDGYRRHARLDAAYLVEVLERRHAAPEVRAATAYVPNASLYTVGDRCRYVRSRPGADERRHLLVSVRDSAVLRAALAAAAGGVTPGALVASLVEQGEAEERARRFVDDLVEQQVLVPTLELQVTGADATYGLGDEIPELAAVRDDLAALDATELGVEPDRYRGIAARLDGLTEKPRLDRLFQVDMRKRSPAAVLGTDVVQEILRAMELQRRIAPSSTDEGLRRFVERFTTRYEGRSVPLLEALDPDLGVGFDEDDAGSAPLLEGVRGSGPATSEFAARDEHLLRRLLEIQAAGAHELVLDSRDLEALERDDAPPLADACAAMAVVAASSAAELASGRFRVLLIGADGPSGAKLLGRFCHADPALQAAVEEHLRAEEALDPDAVFAEIVHLPRARDVNVVARPVLREYEIACLGRPGAPSDLQLPLDDLTVAVDGGRVVLGSRRLGRRIVPRLTSAHNFGQRGVAAYRFLCRLQTQGVASASGLWGPLAAAPWLPRVRRGRIVLQRERWRIAAGELDLGSDLDLAFRAIQGWRAERGVPRLALFSDGGLELPIDFDNVLSVDQLVQALRGRTEAHVYELFPDSDSLCAHGPEGAFVHELVVPFVRERPRAAVARQQAAGEADRRFPPGSEWLYARFYAGAVAGDAVLTGHVAPLVRDMLDSGAADSWFFLRYADPELHLRLRFRGEPERLAREVRPAVEETGARLLEQGLAWRVELGTYEREVERYGGPDAIEAAERIFRADSDAVLALLALLEPGDRGQEERWRIGLCGAHLLLADLGLDLAQRLDLVRARAASIAGDLKRAGTARAAIGKRFRTDRELLGQLLDPDPDGSTGFEPGFAVLRERSEAIRPLAAELGRLEAEGKLTLPGADVAGSLLHMHLNRLLRGDNTAQEGVICDFLARLYEAQLRTA
ncbi:MAG TPA: lantibiotic dehydratase [Gaiellaceae bacterium]|nr:lantibiotic dehydratase [Gaiellaceae bacterium]